MTEDRHLLIVEDDPTLLMALSESFMSRGYQVTWAMTEEEAIRRARKARPTHAVIDLKLAEGSGLEVVSWLGAQEPRPKIVVMTGFASISTTVNAIKLGAVHYLAKPATAREIEAAFDHVAGRDMPEIVEGPRVSSLKTQEWETIQRTMAETDFNVSETARRLGMHRRTLARKLAKQPIR
ncbi:response regulator transcription factor [Stagnihabitans tardus]|uniref:Response regulator n=1 Tax=Stagnihabitans tardus TaxID=2699202 RepID=A0AAE4YGD3_9RHOB|nr:response regulator [Stagnihabitans tardus]NBZ89485.1 response regulator [Stagnihabitans tardus]